MSTRETHYKLIASTLALVGALIIVGSVSAYYIQLNYQGLSNSSTDWGTFGDFVSGLAGTLISLLTLFALALTLHLQAKELAETRIALAEQAKTAGQQLALTLQLEQRRVRPLVKVQWVREAERSSVKSTDQTRRYQRRVWLKIMNIGLGTAVLETIELLAHGQQIENPAANDYSNSAKAAIMKAIGDQATNDVVRKTVVWPLNHQTRALAAGSEWNFIRCDLNEGRSKQGQSLLEKNLELVVHFRSMLGERFSTRDQFDFQPLSVER